MSIPCPYGDPTCPCQDGDACNLGLSPEVAARFWAKVDQASASACREWRGARTPDGYGTFSVPGIGTCYAHRLVVGALDGEEVMHSCDNPPCINRAHLIRADRSANQRDSVAKGRHFTPFGWRGEANPASKLTADEVLAIRASAVSQRELARQYDVSRRLIYNIVNRKAWAHV